MGETQMVDEPRNGYVNTTPNSARGSENDDDDSPSADITTDTLGNNVGSEQVEKDDVNPAESLALDGGWGWFCVLGSALMHFLLGGVGRTYGLIYLRLLERFGKSAAITAWIGGTMTGIRMGASPLATILCNRFSTRTTVFCGGLLLGSACILSAFPPNLYFMFFSYSILAGLGGTMVYSPSLVMVGQYFKNRRSLASGLSTAGSGLGVFVFPPLLEFLFETYGYFGTMLVIGGIMYNNCISGMLYRPLEMNRPVMEKIRRSKQTKLLTEQDRKDREKPNKEWELKQMVELPSKQEKKDSSCYESICIKIRGKKDQQTPLLDWSLLQNPTFFLFGLAMLFTCISYVSAQLLVPAIAESRNCTSSQASLLLSVLGITDIIGRLGSGFIFDIRFIRRHRPHWFGACIFMTGVTVVCFAFAWNFPSLILVCVVHGVVNGAVISQRAVVLVDLLGVDKLPSGFGFLIFFQGIGVMIGPAIAGLLKDVTGDYNMSYYFCGAAGIVGSLIFYFAHFRDRLCVKSNSKHRASPHHGV